jgi:hypothetical protein
MIRRAAVARGFDDISESCLRAVAAQYARLATSKEYRESHSRMEVDQVEASLREYTDSEPERDWIRARVFAAVGDRLWDQGDCAAARAQYIAALKTDPWTAKVYAKLMFLSLGKAGGYARERIRSHRQATRSHRAA